jgi:hypothetical protein
MNQQGIAIVIAGALIAAAIALTNRWAIQIGPDGGTAVRLDRWTGTVVVCAPQPPNLELRCSGQF